MNFTNKVSMLKNPYALSVAVTASYLAFYTAYDKKEKKLVPANVVDMFTGKRGWDWSLVEANKALSLSAMTTMMMAYLPEYSVIQKDLLFVSMLSLWAHGTYSFYKFYQLDLRKVFSEKIVKRSSLFLAAAAQLAVAGGYWEQFSMSIMAVSTTVLGFAHFYTYEIDYKYQLQVRPFAYVTFPLAGAVLYYNAANAANALKNK